MNCYKDPLSNYDIRSREVFGSCFKAIQGHNDLIYDKNTHVVYYLVVGGNSYPQPASHLFAPYISANGKFCRYENGELVEIT